MISSSEKKHLLAKYYKYYNLSDVSPEVLKNEEHYNLYRKPLKEKRSEHPRVIAWKENAIQQSDLAEIQRLSLFSCISRVIKTLSRW